MKEINFKSLTISPILGLVIWFITAPEGVQPNARLLLEIVVAIIAGTRMLHNFSQGKPDNVPTYAANG